MSITDSIEKGTSKVLWILGNIANNVNQIAHRANENQFLSELDLSQVLEELSKLDTTRINLKKNFEILNKTISEVLEIQKKLLDEKST